MKKQMIRYIRLHDKYGRLANIIALFVLTIVFILGLVIVSLVVNLLNIHDNYIAVIFIIYIPLIIVAAPWILVINFPNSGFVRRILGIVNTKNITQI